MGELSVREQLAQQGGGGVAAGGWRWADAVAGSRQGVIVCVGGWGAGGRTPAKAFRNPTATGWGARDRLPARAALSSDCARTHTPQGVSTPFPRCSLPRVMHLLPSCCALLQCPPAVLSPPPAAPAASALPLCLQPQPPRLRWHAGGLRRVVSSLWCGEQRVAADRGPVLGRPVHHRSVHRPPLTAGQLSPKRWHARQVRQGCSISLVPFPAGPRARRPAWCVCLS